MKAAEWMRRCPLAHGVPVKPTQGSVLMLHSQPGCPFQHTHTHPFAQLCFSIFHSFYALSIATITCCDDILYNVKIRRKESQCGACVPQRHYCDIYWNVSPEYLADMHTDIFVGFMRTFLEIKSPDLVCHSIWIMALWTWSSVAFHSHLSLSMVQYLKCVQCEKDLMI